MAKLPCSKQRVNADTALYTVADLSTVWVIADVFEYEADSEIDTPSAPQLRTAGQNYPAQVVPAYLRLPALDPRIPRLAATCGNSVWA